MVGSQSGSSAGGAQSPTPTMVPLALIERNEDTCPRLSRSKARVSEFAELYRQEGIDALPPIVVGKDCYEEGARPLIDGWHRVEAAEKAGLEALPALIRPIETDAEVYAEAVKLSAISSAPLTIKERRIAIDRLLQMFPNSSERAIARTVGVTRYLVAERRRLLQEGGADEEGGGGAGDGKGLEKAARSLLSASDKMLEHRGLLARLPGGGGRASHQMAEALAQEAFRKWGGRGREATGRLEGVGRPGGCPRCRSYRKAEQFLTGWRN